MTRVAETTRKDEDEKERIFGGKKDRTMGLPLRLRQFTPFFPTSISPAAHPSAASAPEVAGTAVITAGAPLATGQEGIVGVEGTGEDFGPLLNYTIWMMTGVSLTVLVLRVYCKISRDRRLWWDDWVLKLSWVGSCPPFSPAPFPYTFIMAPFSTSLNGRGKKNEKLTSPTRSPSSPRR